MSNDKLPFTVVGFYPDTQETYVEWVEEVHPDDAVAVAVAVDDARLDACIVAVFEGHMVDKRNNLGLESGDAELWHQTR